LTPAPSIIILQHGTTLKRAWEIEAHGPNPNYAEPNSGGRRYDPPGFSTARLDRPFGVGTPEQYARSKSANFPDEGGPVILEIEVPLEIIEILESHPDARDAMESGDTLFDPAFGIKELRAEWPKLIKRVIKL
jgi:hypothetical protein